MCKSSSSQMEGYSGGCLSGAHGACGAGMSESVAQTLRGGVGGERRPGPVLAPWEDRSRPRPGGARRFPHDCAALTASRSGAPRNDPPGAPCSAPGGVAKSGTWKVIRRAVVRGRGAGSPAGSWRRSAAWTTYVPLGHLRAVGPLEWSKWIGRVTTCETPSRHARRAVVRDARGSAPRSREHVT